MGKRGRKSPYAKPSQPASLAPAAAPARQDAAPDRPSLAQRRAGHALARIKTHQEQSSEQEQDAYIDYVKALPTAITLLGLGQALALEHAQGKKDRAKGQGGQSPNAHALIYQDMQSWLCGGDPVSPFANDDATDHALLSALCTSPRQQYRVATIEALAYAEWLKTLAVALLTAEPEASHTDKATAS